MNMIRVLAIIESEGFWGATEKLCMYDLTPFANFLKELEMNGVQLDRHQQTLIKMHTMLSYLVKDGNLIPEIREIEIG